MQSLSVIKGCDLRSAHCPHPKGRGEHFVTNLLSSLCNHHLVLGGAGIVVEQVMLPPAMWHHLWALVRSRLLHF